MECNSQKGQTSADDFLRRLYREGRLTSREVADRLGAVEALAPGKLRPQLAAANVKTQVQTANLGQPSNCKSVRRLTYR
jgi:hypothetical protein